MDKAVLMTVEIDKPGAKRKRRVLVTGAPVGEAPVIRRGNFGDLHRLIDEVWVAILRREPQVVGQAKAAGDDAVAADLAKAEAEPVEVEPVEADPGREAEIVPADDARAFPAIVPNDAGYKIVPAPANAGAAAQGSYEQPGML